MKTLFGGLLTSVQNQRKFTRDRAIADLYKRNGTYPSATDYKLTETSSINHYGAEVSEYHLYKLIDSLTTVLSSKVLVETEGGEK